MKIEGTFGKFMGQVEPFWIWEVSQKQKEKRLVCVECGEPAESATDKAGSRSFLDKMGESKGTGFNYVLKLELGATYHLPLVCHLMNSIGEVN